MRWQQMPRFLPKWHLGQKNESQLCVEVTGVPPAGSLRRRLAPAQLPWRQTTCRAPPTSVGKVVIGSTRSLRSAFLYALQVLAELRPLFDETSWTISGNQNMGTLTLKYKGNNQFYKNQALIYMEWV